MKANEINDTSDLPDSFNEHYDPLDYQTDYDLFEQNQIDMDGFYGEYETDFDYED